MHKIINLTPFPVTLRIGYGKDTTDIVFKSKGKVFIEENNIGTTEVVLETKIKNHINIDDQLKELAFSSTKEPELKPENKVEVYQRTIGRVTGLPPPIDNVFYIVRKHVALALKDTRKDLLVCGIGADAKITNGKVIYIRSFIQY